MKSKKRFTGSTIGRQMLCRAKRLTIQQIGFLLLTFISLELTGCAEDTDYPDDPFGNFDALAEIIDSRYCFFADKDIDWEEVAKRYRARITPETRQLELFNICSEMLDELKDGHVNLSSRFNTSYYRAWWSDYPQDFNLRTLQEYYLKFDYGSTSGMLYKYFPEEKAGYIYYPSFSSGISEVNLDYVLAQLYDAESLIIDIRDNGGGLLTNIDVLIGRLIEDEIPGGTITHKTGPGHDDFSKPYPFTYKSAPEYRIHFLHRPVYILTNRSCYSAANAFTAVAKSLPNVKIIGARTGGGGGLPFSSELPNGWSIRFSASPLYGPDGEITEFGIDPSEGYECHSPEKELAQGHDEILERALELCRESNERFALSYK
ncbi:MAG: S41 family peptidase [Bacteroidales bacterium]|nr:S41 family peptidase [Bacteroidales bacterium]